LPGGRLHVLARDAHRDTAAIREDLQLRQRPFDFGEQALQRLEGAGDAARRDAVGAQLAQRAQRDQVAERITGGGRNESEALPGAHLALGNMQHPTNLGTLIFVLRRGISHAGILA
jgi:hypothetical protein